jgi:hypothetical protein
VENREGQRLLGRPRHRWNNNIKMDLKAMGWGWRLDSSDLKQGPVAGCCEYGKELSRSRKYGGIS